MRTRRTPVAAAAAAGVKLTEPGLDEQVFHAPRDDKWRDAWNITDRLPIETARETKAHGAKFVLTILSTPGSVFPDAQMRARYEQSLGVSTLFYPEQRLQQLGQANGFPVIALAPEMQKRADATHVYFHGFPNTKQGFGHWNETGHALAADLIAERLCSSSQ
jgi:hypothetical protein